MYQDFIIDKDFIIKKPFDLSYPLKEEELFCFDLYDYINNHFSQELLDFDKKYFTKFIDDNKNVPYYIYRVLKDKKMIVKANFDDVNKHIIDKDNNYIKANFCYLYYGGWCQHYYGCVLYKNYLFGYLSGDIIPYIVNLDI